MSDLKSQAEAIVRDLHRLAAEQPDTRKGHRVAAELYRAAACLEHVYKFGEFNE